MSEYVPMILAIPPQCAVSQVVGYIKAKSSIQVERMCMASGKGISRGQHSWVPRYCVSTIGRDEAELRAYIRSQDQETRRLDKMKIGD